MFAYGHAAAPSWRECVSLCAQRRGRPGRGLGFVYFTDAFVGSAQQILDALKERTGVENWVGSVGLGVLATGADMAAAPNLDEPGAMGWEIGELEAGAGVGVAADCTEVVS